MFEQLGVIGCGLMGGSFALALKRAGLVKRVVGYSKSPSTTEQAQAPRRHRRRRRIGAARGLAAPTSCCSRCRCRRPRRRFKAIRHLVEPGTLVMDVGSTKRDVVDAARRVLQATASPRSCRRTRSPARKCSGIDHADAALYSGRQVILTPLPQTSPELVQKATDVWAAIGAQVLRMTPENHDAAFAAVSHLPHMLAFAYFNAVARPARRARLPFARPARAFATSRASPPATRRSGATS